MIVVTWESPMEQRLNVCPNCERELRAKHEWPKDSRGEEYCQVYIGAHDGTCDICIIC